MSDDASALRHACDGYPRNTVIEALDFALAAVEPNRRRRGDLAALLATWVADESALVDPPPVAPSVVANVRSYLRARAH